MLFLHEVHRMVGRAEKDFEAAYRDGWMPLVAADDDARLLWFLHHAHGSGASYQAVTVTALADAAAWERLALRVQHGDLQAWAREVDAYRHDVTARLLTPLDFSPLDVRLADVVTEVPASGRLHDATLYMEDTMWTKVGRLDDYLAAVGSIYASLLGSGGERSSIQIAAAYQTLPGAGRHPEVTLLQRVNDMDRLVSLLTTDPPEETIEPGTWMHDALEFRDRWVSKLLRTAVWSPLD